MIRCIFLLISILILPPVQSAAQITFSEIMFDPATNEFHDEYIELFNLSKTDSIQIEGWEISDGRGNDRLLSHSGSKKIGPLSFAVILDGSYILNSATYDSVIPAHVSVLIIDNSSFGANGLSNSASETLVLINTSGDTISQYSYSVDNEAGSSDEKILLDQNNTPDNWANSRVIGGTPGTRNSVSPFEYDAGFGIDAIHVTEPLFAGDDADIIVSMQYLGTHSSSDSALLFIYVAREGIPGENILAVIPVFFRSGQDISISTTWRKIAAGEYKIIAELKAAWDMNPLNDLTSRHIVVFSRVSSVHINEIKFLTAEDEPEWIELVNSSSEPVFLKSWQITDAKDTTEIDSAVFLYPHQYKVISEDSLTLHYDLEDSLVIITDHFPSLNNSGDEITLIHPSGNWIERINYTIHWLEGEDYRNVSLERINPLLNYAVADNWGPCVLAQGASPGDKNSIMLELNRTKTRISVSPNPFSPDADGYDDTTVISGVLSEKSYRLRIRVFDINGKLVRTIADNRYSGSEFRVLWNGRNSRNALMPVGIYIILIEALNDRNGVYFTEKSWVVLAKKL